MLKDKSGFGWDPLLCTPVASESVWNDLIEKNPSVSKCRDKPFPLFEDASLLFDGSVATGYAAIPLLDILKHSQASPERIADKQHEHDHQTESSSSDSDQDPLVSQLKASENSDSSEPAPKRPRTVCSQPKRASTPRSAGMMIAESLGKIADRVGTNQAVQPPSVHQTDHEVVGRAVEILDRDYASRWDPSDIAVAYDIISVPSKAFLFNRMAHMPSRDAWLQRQIAQSTCASSSLFS